MFNVKVIDNFDTFPESAITPSYDQRFRSYSHWKLGKVSVLDRSCYLVKFGLYIHFYRKYGQNLNIKILENFITFLTMGRT
jgi:predicted phosphoadenosine phosphosulfate sulfurtransferase